MANGDGQFSPEMIDAMAERAALQGRDPDRFEDVMGLFSPEQSQGNDPLIPMGPWDEDASLVVPHPARGIEQPTLPFQNTPMTDSQFEESLRSGIQGRGTQLPEQPGPPDVQTGQQTQQQQPSASPQPAQAQAPSLMDRYVEGAQQTGQALGDLGSRYVEGAQQTGQALGDLLANTNVEVSAGTPPWGDPNQPPPNLTQAQPGLMQSMPFESQMGAPLQPTNLANPAGSTTNVDITQQGQPGQQQQAAGGQQQGGQQAGQAAGAQAGAGEGEPGSDAAMNAALQLMQQFLQPPQQSPPPPVVTGSAPQLPTQGPQMPRGRVGGLF